MTRPRVRTSSQTKKISKKSERGAKPRSDDIRFEKSVLPSGLTVVTEFQSGTNAVSCGLWVPKGTRHEPEKLLGIAHFVEHMVFKQTKLRSAFEIVRDMEAVGGDLNAFTSRENTCFVTASLAEDLGLSIDLLGDLVTSPTFDKNDIKKEKQVVIQEIAMAEDMIEENIFDYFFSEAFKGTDLERPILGTKKAIGRLTLDDISQFHQSRYGVSDLVLSVAGKLEHEQVLDWADKYIVKRSPKAASKVSAKTKTAFKKSSGFKVDAPQAIVKAQRLDWPKAFRTFKDSIRKPSEQVHILVGWPTVAFTEAGRFEAYIVNAALGGGMTSRLYQKIREEKGLVYTVYSQISSFVDAGVFSVYAATERKNAKDVMSIILDEIEKLAKHGMSNTELKLFKTQVRGQLLLGAEDIDNRMNSIGINEMVFEEYRPVESVIADVEKVSQESLKAFFKTSFDIDKISAVFMGDVK
jgi:predicted Zn-dependent peptidase